MNVEPRSCANCRSKVNTAVWPKRYAVCPICMGKPVPKVFISRYYSPDAEDDAVLSAKLTAAVAVALDVDSSRIKISGISGRVDNIKGEDKFFMDGAKVFTIDGVKCLGGTEAYAITSYIIATTSAPAKPGRIGEIEVETEWTS